MIRSINSSVYLFYVRDFITPFGKASNLLFIYSSLLFLHEKEDSSVFDFVQFIFQRWTDLHCSYERFCKFLLHRIFVIHLIVCPVFGQVRIKCGRICIIQNVPSSLLFLRSSAVCHGRVPNILFKFFEAFAFTSSKCCFQFDLLSIIDYLNIPL
jgi:hypothetical protein